jgi:hypothetical protein
MDKSVASHSWTGPSLESVRRAGETAFFLLLPFVLFYWQFPFLGRLTIGNDYPAWGIGQQMMLQYSLHHGTFPLFMPGFADGQVAAAMTLGQMAHPFSHVAACMPGYWSGRALEWNTLLRLLSLGFVQLILFRLLRRLRLSIPLSFTISFVTVYNLSMLDSFRYGASLENYTGSLLLCAAMAFFFLKPSRFGGPLAIVATTCWLTCGGHPQKMYYGFLAAAIAFLFIPALLSDEAAPSKTRRHYFVAVPLLVLLGILLSSFYLFPFLADFMGDNSIRVGQDFGWSLIPRDSIPGLLGSLVRPLGGDVHGAFGSASIAALVCLAPLVLFSRRQRRFPLLTAWLTAAVVLLCSFGDKTPVYGLFWKYFPFTSSFRGPVRITVVLPFLFLLMLARLLRRENGADRFPILLIAGAIPLYWISYHLVSRVPADPAAMTPQRIHPMPPWVEPALLWLGLGTFLLALLHLLPKIDRRRLASRIAGGGLAIFVAAQGVIEMRFGTWVAPRHDKPTMQEMDRQIRKKLTYCLGSDYSLQSSQVTRQKSRSTVDAYLARFWRRCVRTGDEEASYAYMAGHDVSRTLCLESAVAPGAENGAETIAGADRLELRYASFNRLDFDLQAEAPGYMTLAFPYSNNWRAFVDRAPASLFRGNGYLLAVPLTAGSHRVRFEYHSRAASAGMAISCMVLLLVGLRAALGSGLRRSAQIVLALIALLVPPGLYISCQHSLYGGENLRTTYTWSSDQFPPDGNLAYGKTCRASSTERLEDYPGLAVDGYERNSFRTRPGMGEWWQVDLGREIPLQKLVIQRKRVAGFSPARLAILFSSDGKTFTPAAELTDLSENAPLSILLKGRPTRYLRLNSLDPAPVAIRELEAYAAPVSLPGAN